MRQVTGPSPEFAENESPAREQLMPCSDALTVWESISVNFRCGVFDVCGNELHRISGALARP